MRRDDDVTELEQRIVIAARLFVREIRGIAAEMPGAQRLDQRCAFHEVGARDVYEHCAALDEVELATTDDAAGFGIPRKVEADVIAAGEQFAERNVTCTITRFLLARQAMALRVNDPHAACGCP